MALLYRLYWSVGMDVLLHLIVRWLARWLPRACTRFFFRRLMAWLIPQHWKVVDRSDRQLTMKHELFRHIEIEMFVRQSQLPAASDFVVQLMKFADGQREALSEATRGALATAGVWSTVEACLGQYQHHYPICIRKVLPDDTLISMSTGDEAWYALSFISYALPSQRCGFERFAAALARSTAALFGARPHWGKLCPLTPSELRANYPRWDEFFRLVREIDPSGRFRNPWTATFVD